MKKQTIYVALNVHSKAYLCKDGKFREAILFGQGRYDTLVYSTIGHARNKLRKVSPKKVVGSIANDGPCLVIFS